MPFIEHDKQFTEKKKHIGNDFVTIVYNDSGEDYRMGTIKVKYHIMSEALLLYFSVNQIHRFPSSDLCRDFMGVSINGLDCFLHNYEINGAQSK